MRNGRFAGLGLIQKGVWEGLVAASMAFCILVFPVGAQESFTMQGSTILYQKPDPSRWQVVHNGVEPKSKAYLVMFKHNPIKDDQGRDIEPVIGIICETVPNSVDVTKYSIDKRVHTPFEVKKVLAPQDGYFTHKTAIGYEGEYKRGTVLHKVLVGHLRYRNLGVQVLCDSTAGVYDKVQADMLGLLRSVTCKD